MSEKVENLLSDIKHPSGEEYQDNVAYSMNLDQNLLNGLISELSTTKQKLSLRKIGANFDTKGQYIKMLTTTLLQLNMPQLTK